MFHCTLLRSWGVENCIGKYINRYDLAVLRFVKDNIFVTQKLTRIINIK